MQALIVFLIGAISGALMLLGIQSVGLPFSPGGTVNEIRPAVIKASAVEMVDQHVTVRSTTEIDDEGLTKVVIPLLKLDVNLAKRYARGNGGCLIGVDNQKLEPYFEDEKGARKSEAPTTDRVTLVVGEPEVIFCGITGYTYRDGPSLPFASAPTSLYNGLFAESLHQVVCVGNDNALHNAALESARSNIVKFLELVGFKDPKVKFEKPLPPEVSGTPVPRVTDPSIVPNRACAQTPPPRLIPTPTRK